LQILSLLAGISRSGVTMVGGLWRGLDHEDAARFAFLLATPVILAAGVLKLPSSPATPEITSTGSSRSASSSPVSPPTFHSVSRALLRNPHSHPFAIYCLIAGAASLLRFTAF